MHARARAYVFFVYAISDDTQRRPPLVRLGRRDVAVGSSSSESELKKSASRPKGLPFEREGRGGGGERERGKEEREKEGAFRSPCNDLPRLSPYSIEGNFPAGRQPTLISDELESRIVVGETRVRKTDRAIRRFVFTSPPPGLPFAVPRVKGRQRAHFRFARRARPVAR